MESNACSRPVTWSGVPTIAYSSMKSGVPSPSVLASGMRHTQGLGSDVDGPGQRSLYGLLRAALMARVYALQDRMMDFVLKHCLICAHSPQPRARVDLSRRH